MCPSSAGSNVPAKQISFLVPASVLGGQGSKLDDACAGFAWRPGTDKRQPQAKVPDVARIGSSSRILQFSFLRWRAEIAANDCLTVGSVRRL